jgi:hypothetical protein
MLGHFLRKKMKNKMLRRSDWTRIVSIEQSCRTIISLYFIIIFAPSY